MKEYPYNSEKMSKDYLDLFENMINNKTSILENRIPRNTTKLSKFIYLLNKKIKMKTIMITGTNGKSTTCKMIEHLFKKVGIKTITGGNIGKPILSCKILQEMNVANNISRSNSIFAYKFHK